MADGFHETPVRGKHRHNTSAPADTAVSVLPAVATNLDPAYTEGNVVGLSTDLTGNLRVVLSGSDNGAGGTLVDVSDRAGRLVGVVTLDAATLGALESVDLNAATRDDLVTRLSANLESVDLNADTLAALESVDLNVATRDDIVNRLSTNLESVDLNVATRDDIVNRLSTALESVDLNAATLDALERTTPQVRGADVSDTNPLPVNIQTNPGTLVDSGLLSSVDLAPGASATLASAAVGTGLTGRLVELTAASSVRIKVTLRTSTGGATPTVTDRRVFFVDPSANSLVYLPVDRDALTAPAGGVFQIVVTNMDNLRTADVYASTTHVEI